MLYIERELIIYLYREGRNRGELFVCDLVFHSFHWKRILWEYVQNRTDNFMVQHVRVFTKVSIFLHAIFVFFNWIKHILVTLIKHSCLVYCLSKSTHIFSKKPVFLPLYSITKSRYIVITSSTQKIPHYKLNKMV